MVLLISARFLSSSSSKCSSLKHASRFKPSSQQWLHRQMSDPYVKKAQSDNYRCRSAYKLIEMDDKYNFLKPGSVVVDLGASPGSWSQVAARRVNSDKNGRVP